MITSKEKNFISAVLYAHNADKDIRATLEKLYSVLEANFDHYEIICVNDASTDQTRQEISTFSKALNTAVISVINMSSFQGIELSMNAGVDLAIGDFVYEFDSVIMDYDVQLITDVYRKALDEGCDIVAAVPEHTSGKASRFFYKIFNRYSLSNTPIQQEVFRILSRRAINRVKSLNRTLVYRKAVYATCGLRTAAVRYDNQKRKRDLNAEEKANRIDLAADSLILFTNAVQKLSLYICIFFLGTTVIIGIYTWGAYFSAHKPVEGWTPLMLFLSIGFFGIFLILTVTLQYLSVILRLVYKKRQYLIESIDKITNN